MDVPLQPLRIPDGWAVIWNDGLYEIDPVAKAIPEDWHDVFFREDMLHLEHAHFKRVLDVGWYPAGDLEHGAYGLRLFESSYDDPIHKYETRDRLALVAEIERLLLGVHDQTL